MASTTYLGLLRSNTDYRRLWLGQVVSFFGDWFKSIALYTIVAELTDSALALSLVLVCNMLPIFLMVPIAGPLVDRFDRRILMIGTDIARAICAVGLIAAHWTGSLPLLYAVLVVGVCFAGIFIPARTAVVPDLCSEEELPVGMALSGGTWSVMLAFGAATGGLVTEWLGTDAALLLDGATYLLSAAFLWGLPALPPGDEDDGSEAGFVEGLRYLRRRPYLTLVLMLKPSIGAVGASVAMIPLFGTSVYAAAAGPAFVGFLYSMRGLGALIGSLGMRVLTGDEPGVLRAGILPAFLLTAVSYFALSLAPNVYLAGVCYLVATIGTGVVWVFAGILGQRASDSAYRGRIFSLEFGMNTLTASVTSVFAGVVIDSYGWTAFDVAELSAFTVVGPIVLWSLGLWWLKPEGDGHVPMRPVEVEVLGGDA